MAIPQRWTGADEYIDTVFRQLLQGVSRHLPSQCAVCHAWPAHSVCEACVAAFAQPSNRCATCACLLAPGLRQCGACIVDPPPLDACLAAVDYAYPWSNLVAEFKFLQHPAWATSFARLMRATPWVEPTMDAAHVLIPMPLSRQRLQERGYNQAQLLACALDAPKVAHDTLLRTVDTPPQRTLPRSERLRSVRHAFAVEPVHTDRVRGQRILLVDDVMTSGASLHAAARTLRQAGATQVAAVVFCRTDLP